MAVSAFADTLSEVGREKPKVIASVSVIPYGLRPGSLRELEEQDGQNDCKLKPR